MKRFWHITVIKGEVVGKGTEGEMQKERFIFRTGKSGQLSGVVSMATCGSYNDALVTIWCKLIFNQLTQVGGQNNSLNMMLIHCAA